MMNEMEIREKREEFESLIQSWNGTKMWFQERRLQFPGIVQIITDDWGVSITITSEYFRKISISGCWEILRVSSSGMSGLYVGWTLNKQIIYPEIGIFPPNKIVDIHCHGEEE